MIQRVEGTVKGLTIELARDIGLVDGQQVELEVKVIERKDPWGEGLRRCAGVLAEEWTDEDDRVLAELRQLRKVDRVK